MEKPVFVVGIGASAGGLEAIQAFFDSMPETSGIAFVIVQHLSPDFKSMMIDLLASRTRIPAQQAEHDVEIGADNIYLIPPGKMMTIRQGRLQLVERNRSRVPEKPIDIFFSSLAEDLEVKAVAVILSGTGDDGSQGVLRINEHGGLVLVQEPTEAKFDGMPRNALATGMVNKTLPVQDMADFLLAYTMSPGDSLSRHEPFEHVPDFHGQYPEIFRHIYARYRLDMDEYKTNTINRRIIRRIRALLLSTPEEYVQRLVHDESEVEALFRDLIIGVTSFFRDEEAFESLATLVIPELVKRAKNEIRVWVCGCSTGEEAYSIAMLLADYLRKHEIAIPFKIFATDLSADSVRVAGRGIYNQQQIASLPPYYRDRFCTESSGTWQIDKELRNNLVFSVHNVLAEPPFTKLDLVACRNLLIYLVNNAQTKVLKNLHFGLKRDGFMFLGTSETPGTIAPEFEALNRYNIFRKVGDARLPPLYTMPRGDGAHFGPRREDERSQHMLASEYDSILQEVIPNGMVVNHLSEITHVFGKARRLIEIPDGRLAGRRDIQSLLREDLRVFLNAALIKARKDRTRVSLKHVRLTVDGEEASYDVVVRPLNPDASSIRHFLVMLQDEERVEPQFPPAELNRSYTDDVQLITELQRELQFTRESLNATIEEVETSNEELQSTNEELLASNEELQSTNEELQSVNEELYTVNSQHQEKIIELERLNADLDNLLTNTALAIIFLGKDKTIRRFTPEALDLFNLVDHDIGRPIGQFTHNLDYSSLDSDLNLILNGNTQLVERTVQDFDGHNFLLRITPYRDRDSVGGVVLKLVNTDPLVKMTRLLEESERQYRALFNKAPIPLLLLSADHVIETASDRWLEFMGFERNEVIGLPATRFMIEEDTKTFDAHHEEPDAPDVSHSPQLYRSEKKDGEIAHVRIFSTEYVDHNDAAKVIWGVEDVTRLVALEEARQEILHRLNLALDAADIGVFEVYKDGSVVWDPSLYRLIGIPDEGKTNPLLSAMDLRNAAIRRAFIRAVLDSGERKAVEMRIPRRDGAERIYRLTAETVHGRTIGIAQDVTDEIERRQETERHQMELLRANRLTNVGTMAAGVAHEINNPLSVIKTQTQTIELAMARGVADNAMIAQSLEDIGHTVDRIANIIKGLRNFSRDASTDPLELLDPSLVVQESVGFCKLKLEKEGVTLTYDEALSGLTIRGRNVELSQVLVNLIDNARDALAGSTVKEIEIRISPTPHGVDIIVFDSGPGVPREIEEKIFDPFFSTKPSGSGAGLGLSICKGIVESHQGALRYGRVDGRSRFTISLPAPDDGKH